MISRLPHWVLTEKYPAFYDSESKTAVEMVAKVYGKMQEIIDEYNKYVDEINSLIETFTSEINCSQKEFETRMTKLIHDYIDYMDTKYAEQDKEINEAITYMKENLSQSITEIITEMKELGQIDEAILNAIDGIGTRVSTLETKNTEIESRIETIENSSTYFTYNEETKELDLIIDEKVGV